ncbi:WD40 repeat-like protein [Neoconidiobolus thromboides FSU 785]|nr:WD40 repeat-like protein [Neoconidiobolus thromboides FSU 785]
MATAMHDSYIKLWSLKGEKLRNLKATFNATMVNEESSLDINREKGGSEFKLLIGHSGPVYGISFSPCSRYLISCSEDGTVRLWNTLTFICLACYRGHNYPIWDVDFSPNGTYFVTASHDRTARLWSTEHTSPLRIFAGHISDVDCVKFHPNGRYVATGSTDKTARLWDISTGSCVRVFTGHTSSIDRIAVSNNGKLLATAGSDGHILVWDILTGRLTHTFEDPQGLGTTYSLTFSYSDESLISGGNDYKIRIWDVQAPTNNPVPPVSQPAIADTTSKPSHPIKVFKTKRTSILHLKCTPRNLILAAGSFNP